MSELASERRVREQMVLSERVYGAIDTTLDGAPRHRHVLRECVGILAVNLETSLGHRYAGDAAHAHLLQHLAQGSLTTSDAAYAPYPVYRDYANGLRELHPLPLVSPSKPLADKIAQYGNVNRATRDSSGENETNSRHVAHVVAMAVPYALQEYPDLDPSLVSSYGFVHDILEAYTGDVATFNISAEAYEKKQLEEAGTLDIFAREFAAKYPKLVALLERYETLQGDEARFVKTYEKSDPGYTHFANGGTVIKELGVTTPRAFWQEHRKTYLRMSAYAHNFPQIIEERDIRAQKIEQLVWPASKRRKSRS